MTLLLVALGAALGAPLRYLTDRAVRSRCGSAFPWGTLTVNVLGSFLLGLLVTLPADPALTALVGAGFCGALTTYSTFAYEILVLGREKSRWSALANVVASVLGGLASAYAGLLVGTLLLG